jgi:hypothetical protein
MTDSPRSDSFRPTLVDALGTVDLRRLQLSWALTSFGQWAFFVILAVYAYEQGGASAVGVAALVRMVPAGLTAPMAGLVIDRSSRRDVLLGTDVARAAALAGVAAAVAAAALVGVVLVLSARTPCFRQRTSRPRPPSSPRSRPRRGSSPRRTPCRARSITGEFS